MFTLTLIAVVAIVAAVAITEVRMGRIRWLLADANNRIQGLEASILALTEQIAALRQGRGSGSATGQPAPDLAPQSPPVINAATAVPSTRPSPASMPDADAAKMAVEAARTAAAPAGSGSVPPVPPGSVAPTTPPPPSPPSESLEQRLGTRWAVWVGGLALGLGGLLLVRYSIEQGYFGPGARIIMGLLFAAVLLGAGEWFRRTGYKPALDALPTAHIPSILTAAGSLSLFGTIYAAYALYDFIGPAAAFVLLGAVGVLTMFAAALHGPLLAGLGIAASYAAPMLVSSAKPSPWPLVIYLGVVAASALTLARIRSWLWLGMVAVAGAAVWGYVFLDPMSRGSTEWTLGGYLHTIIQLILAAGVFGLMTHGRTPDHEARPDPIASLALAVLSLVAVLMLIVGRYDLAAAVPFTLIIAGILLATAWASPRAAVGSVLAGLVILASVATWPGLKSTTDTSHLLREVAGVLLVPENVTSYLMFAALASLAVTAASGLRLLRGQALPASTAGFYALAATATPLLTLALTYLRVTQFDTSISFAFAAGILALLFAFATERFQRAEIEELPGTRLVTGAFATGAMAALAFGLVAALSRGYLTVALSLTAAGAAYVAVRKDIPLLRHVVAVLAGVVLARIAWDPRIMGDSVGTWPILNWLLIGYGVPAVAFFAAARRLERRGTSVASQLADAAAVLLTGLLCFFEIHHAMHNGDALAPRSGHVEMGVLAVVGFGLSWALMRLDLGRANPVFRWASMIFGVLSGAIILLGLGIGHNPLFSSRELVGGTTVFSTLLLAYLLPGLGAVLLARAARPYRPAWYVTGIAVLAVLLIFGYVTLEVRHAFQGANLYFWRRTEAPEWWSYSAAWLALGIVFLAYGIFRGSIEARLASALLVLLSVIKVFLFDLGGLSGFWRALSFIVLGAVLIGIGLVYQHLVFGQRGQATPPVPAPGPGPTAA
ncbi:MAG: DUF2339 domain-containing protein [Hyphomicrobiaceae bacterium]